MVTVPASVARLWGTVVLCVCVKFERDVRLVVLRLPAAVSCSVCAPVNGE